MTVMRKRRLKAAPPQTWRHRLRAGALAALFAGLAFLPWAHVLTLDGHDGHSGSCRDAHAAEAASVPGAFPLLLGAGADDVCWVCGGLASLFHPDAPAAVAKAVHRPDVPGYAARAPRAPVCTIVYPANRSQAPPAAV
jgi:hypothetical protein